ncbi:MAG TPA: hypothetical protein VN446_06760 [Candidatus Acidoferrum sp.]|nr:hypothetical protein [Candidatus Acidoferrum sp.]
MVTMPDGAQFEMQWKQVKYMNGGHSAAFEIIPMYRGKDIVIMPSATLWREGQSVFSDQERLEIIVLLERIAWKRDIRVIEVNTPPAIDSNTGPVSGSLESTTGYQEMATKNLFDPQSPLSKEQAKEIYCILEKRFAEGASGMVTIPKSVILQGSILAEVSIPVLEKNSSVHLNLV